MGGILVLYPLFLLGGWSGGRPAGISVEGVMRGLGAGRLVLRKRGWRKVFALRLSWSWECVFVIGRGIARLVGRPEGISITTRRVVFKREAVKLGRKGKLLRGNDKEGGESGGRAEARGSFFRLVESLEAMLAVL